MIDHTTVSSRHCTLQLHDDGQVSLTDLGSHNGTWVGEAKVAASQTVLVPLGATLRLGAIYGAIVQPTIDDCLPDAVPSRGTGTVALNRPPRNAPPRQPEPIEVPAAPPVPPGRMPLSLAAIFAPMIFAGVMVAVMSQASYALFALLSPVMAIGTWIESRHRNKKSVGTGSLQYAVELKRFHAAVAELAQQETERRHLALPHPAELLRWAFAPSTRLWERRPHHDDFLQLHGAMGTHAWRPALTGGGGKLPPGVDEALAEAGLLQEVPIPVDLAAGRVAGVVGDRSAALSLARSLRAPGRDLVGTRRFEDRGVHRPRAG